MKKVKIGIIGCGNISSIYMKNCTEVFEILDVVACADILLDVAKSKAEEFNIPIACTVDELLADETIEIVVNLTIPAVHSEITLKALNAGKNVYVEKPFTLEREDGKEILELAKEKNLLIGSAPDTFLGGGLQTCRKLIDNGFIGTPVAATGFMMGNGPESWHPNPEFFYKKGAGPLFDMGPYYITALVTLLGAVNKVTGTATMSYKERVVTSDAHYGERIKVEVPTHVTGILEFDSNVVATLITSFDIRGGSTLPCIEIYGSEGSMLVPDPNTFSGPVKIKMKDSEEWKEVPVTHNFTAHSRGIGVADMAYALQSKRPHRANGNLAYHVLDVMHSIYDSATSGRAVQVESTCDKPAPLPMGLMPRGLDE